MTTELIRVQNGRASMTDAVIEIARILNPLGAAAEIISTVGACAVEISRFKNQRQALIAGHAVATELIRTQQGLIIKLFEARMHDSEVTRVAANKLHSSFDRLVEYSCNIHLPESQIEAVHQTIRMLANGVGNTIRERGENLILLSKSLHVDDTKLAVAAWRALESGRN